jgi:hypothetical protein
MMRLVRTVSHQFLTGHGSRGTSLRKNRKRINQYIRRMGRDANLELSLDPHGRCYIPFKKFLIIIAVPEDHIGSVCFATKVFDTGLSKNPPKVNRRVTLAHNHCFSFGTRGSLLHLEENEVILSCSQPIRDLCFKDMQQCLEDFMQTALNINRYLGSIV